VLIGLSQQAAGLRRTYPLDRDATATASADQKAGPS
jgi:hypothetical protein